MASQMQDQFDFLKLSENDTIVDIGAASGWYEGAFSAGNNFRHIHFILVDIDTNCLNARKLAAMTAHYSQLKGSPITNSFTLVNNTPDSLFLPASTYGKVWLLNVFHEIDDKPKMLRAM